MSKFDMSSELDTRGTWGGVPGGGDIHVHVKGVVGLSDGLGRL